MTDERAKALEERQAQRDRQAALSSLAAALGERYSPARASLDAYRVRYADQRAVVDRLKALVPRLAAHVAAGRGLVFLGSVGTGKDHLMAAMLYHAARQGASCRWANGQELFGRFRDNIDTGRRDEDLFRDLCAPKVLALSDPIPPVGDPGKWDLSNLYRLLDRRYRALGSTWVSLNAASLEEADTRLSAPVFDRLREGAEVFHCFWPSWREGFA